MSYMRVEYVSTRCRVVPGRERRRRSRRRRDNFKCSLSRLAAGSAPVCSGLLWPGLCPGRSHELYKCFGPQLEHFCLTVRMIYVRQRFVQRARETARDCERQRERERAVRTSGGIADLTFCSAQRVLNATACVHTENAQTKAGGRM